MLTKTQEEILDFLLSNPEEQVTIRGIAKRLQKSYPLVYNNISKLGKEEIITKQDVPPAKVIKLNPFSPKEILVDIELKRKHNFLKKHPWIEVMLKDILAQTKNPFFIMLVFGSYAKSTQTKNSDLDLLIILKEKKDIEEIEILVKNAYTKVKKSLNFIDTDDFMQMINNTSELNIGNEAKKHHIILYGVEPYYQLIR